MRPSWGCKKVDRGGGGVRDHKMEKKWVYSKKGWAERTVRLTDSAWEGRRNPQEHHQTFSKARGGRGEGCWGGKSGEIRPIRNRQAERGGRDLTSGALKSPGGIK